MGASNDEARPSNEIFRFLHDLGYNVIPINPNESQVLSKRCYPTLAEASLENDIEVVDVFRRPSEALEIARAAVDIGARAIWFQLGVTNFEAASLAAGAGLMVVMDTCPKIEIPKLPNSTGIWSRG